MEDLEVGAEVRVAKKGVNVLPGHPDGLDDHAGLLAAGEHVPAFLGDELVPGQDPNALTVAAQQ